MPNRSMKFHSDRVHGESGVPKSGTPKSGTPKAGASKSGASKSPIAKNDSVEPIYVHKRIEAMPDGRYLIYYTFPELETAKQEAKG